MIGSVLDKYRILEKIGEGGMASVYRGEHVTLGREVAVKILHPHLSNQQRNRQRFAREARAIENLRHDNILRIEDYSGEEAPDCYIVTEFVDGQTLQQLLADLGPLPSEVVALIGMRLADALQYAHDLGIIHRDLKPENVMIKKDGTVKLMDFGIARFLDEMHLTLTGALVGSPAYMSPEQAMERVLDSRSDLFSLGTLLFHLVTAQLPFAGNNPSIVLRNIIEGNRPGVSDLAHDVAGPLADLVHALLQVDPEDRPRTASEVRDRLGQVLAEVDLDPEDPEWSLQAWLVDPRGYAERLDAWLREVLLRKGKARLEARDHLGALQLFNRLLTIDERLGLQNDEVLSLVQGMHGAREAPRRTWAWWAGGVGLLAVAAALSLLLWPEPPPQPGARLSDRPVVATAPVEAPAVSPAVSPAVWPAQAPAGTPGPSDPGQESPQPGGGQPAPGPTGDQAPAAGAPLAGALRQVDVEPAPRVLPRTAVARSAAAPGADGIDPTATGSDQPEEPGFVTVHVLGSWGHIYIDGAYKGRTGLLRDPIQVSPGTHTLTVKHDLALPHEERFTIAPGETRNITTPALQRRPAMLVVDGAVDAGCAVVIDGTSLGTVASLGRSIALARPEQRHAVELICAEGTSRHEVGPLLAGESAQIP